MKYWKPVWVGVILAFMWLLLPKYRLDDLTSRDHQWTHNHLAKSEAGVAYLEVTRRHRGLIPGLLTDVPLGLPRSTIMRCSVESSPRPFGGGSWRSTIEDALSLCPAEPYAGVLVICSHETLDWNTSQLAKIDIIVTTFALNSKG